MKKTLNILVCLLVVCLVLALTLNILFITGVVSGASGAQGEKGETGATGAPGKDGEDGKTPKIEIKEGFWWIDGENTGVKAVPDKTVEADTLPDPSEYYDGDMCVIPYNSSFVKGTATYCLVNGVWELVEENVEPIPSDELQNENEFHINTLSELKAFRDIVNDGTNFSGKTVYLDADIDLANENWTPIGLTDETQFKGTLDGGEDEGHTIFNLTVNQPTADYAGFFGIFCGTVQNLTFANANIVGKAGCGVVMGSAFNYGTVKNVKVLDSEVYGLKNIGGIAGTGYANFENCTVDGFKAKATPANNDDGDKVGGIIGYSADWNHTIKDCTVKNAELTAFRDLGALVGCYAGVNVVNNVTDNEVDEVILTIDRTVPGGSSSVNVRNLIGRITVDTDHGESIDVDEATAALANGNTIGTVVTKGIGIEL